MHLKFYDNLCIYAIDRLRCCQIQEVKIYLYMSSESNLSQSGLVLHNKKQNKTKRTVPNSKNQVI